MLHYQCCLTCLPHTRLSCSCFFLPEVRFLKFFLKLCWWCKQSLITFHNNCLILFIMHIWQNCKGFYCMLQKYLKSFSCIILRNISQKEVCLKVLACLENFTNSSSWHELKCFLTVCRILLPPLQHCLLSLTLDQTLSFLPTSDQCSPVL